MGEKLTEGQRSKSYSEQVCICLEPASSGVQGLILETVLVNISISNLDAGVEHTIRESDQTERCCIDGVTEQ